MHLKHRVYFLLAAGALAAAARLGAVTTDTAEQVTYDHFEDGQFTNIALPSSGGLRLAPNLTLLAKLDAAVIWRAVADKDGNLYVGTGNSGKVFKVTPDGKSQVIFQPEEVLTRALALDAKGNLYIGTSPNGRVYRLPPGGRPEIFFTPTDTYIWDLVFDQAGNLYVATGAKGRVYRLPPDYQPDQPAEVWYESDRTHISCLALDAQGRLLAGAGPKSLLYRITGKNQATVLANAGSDEITGIYPASDGSVFFSTFNKTAPESTSGSGESASGGNDTSSSGSTPPSSSDDGNADGSDASTTTVTVTTTTSSPGGGPDGAKSQLLRVSPDGYMEPVWSLSKVGVFAFRPLPDGHWLLGTDQQGRLFSAASEQDWELLQETPDSSEVSWLLAAPNDTNSTIVLASNPAQIFRLGSPPAASGNYTCAAFDADQPSRWGSLRALARPPLPGDPLAGAKWETRVGNTPKPDDTWGPWQTVGADAQIPSPAARFFQYRVTLTNPDREVRRVQVYYQHFNAPPEVTRVNVVPLGVDVVPAPEQPRQPIDLRQFTDAGPVLALPPAQPQLRPTGDAGAYTVVWNADDPNGDDLRYTVQLRAIGDQNWVTLADDLDQPVYSFNSRGFTDGYYEVQVTASDKLDNPPGEARTAARISAPFLVDNTPPAVTLVSQSGDATAYTLTFNARDAASILDHAQYTLDGQPPKPALPEGEMFDRQELSFSLVLERLKPGPHSVVFEVTDEANNTASAKISFTSP
jgi:hypothetical protein